MTLTKLKLNESKGGIFFTHTKNFRSHGKQRGGCEIRRMCQRHSPPDAGRKNLTIERPGSNGLVRKLQLLIYEGGVY